MRLPSGPASSRPRRRASRGRRRRRALWRLPGPELRWWRVPCMPGLLLAAMRAQMPSCHAGPMGVRCLIVDDSPGFIQAARALLEQEGMTVVGVASTGCLILISAHAEEEFADLIEASPAAGFLPKSALCADAIVELMPGGRGGPVSSSAPQGTL